MGETHGLPCPLPGPFLPLTLLQPNPSSVKTNGEGVLLILMSVGLDFTSSKAMSDFPFSFQTSLIFCRSLFSLPSPTAFLGGWVVGFFFPVLSVS